jgi:hypothetical protein
MRITYLALATAATLVLTGCPPGVGWNNPKALPPDEVPARSAPPSPPEPPPTVPSRLMDERDAPPSDEDAIIDLMRQVLDEVRAAGPNDCAAAVRITARYLGRVRALRPAALRIAQAPARHQRFFERYTEPVMQLHGYEEECADHCGTGDGTAACHALFDAVVSLTSP